MERIVIGTVLVAVCVVIHALGTSYWVGYLVKRHLGAGGRWRRKSDLWVLISTAVLFLLVIRNPCNGVFPIHA